MLRERYIVESFTHCNYFCKECEFAIFSDRAWQVNVWFIGDDLREGKVSRCNAKEKLSDLQKQLINSLPDMITCAFDVSHVADDGGICMVVATR